MRVPQPTSRPARPPHLDPRHGRQGLPRNVAHRGASAAAPENTLASVRRAVDDGAETVEVDVHRTRDGALVVVHDATLERTTDARTVLPGRRPWRVADLTLDEVARLDAGAWHSPAHAGEVVPTLRDVLHLLAGSSVGLQLEVKTPQAYPGIVHDLVAELAGTRVPVVVQSFSVAAMKELKTHAPERPVGILGRPDVANLAALGSWADQVNPYHWAVDRHYVEQVHRHGMECLVWTVNRAQAMRRAVRLGVDGVITDRPARFRAVRRTAMDAERP